MNCCGDGFEASVILEFGPKSRFRGHMWEHVRTQMRCSSVQGMEYNGDGSTASVMSTPDHTVHDDWRRSTSARSGGGAAVVACEVRR